jgi:hypothetical protein
MTESKRGGKGIRYTVEQKQEVLDFLKEHPGRGNIKLAQDKFGISYLTLRNWQGGGGTAASGGKRGRPRKERGGEGTASAKSSRGGAGEDASFEKAKKLIDRIRDTEMELREYYAELQGLMQP